MYERFIALRSAVALCRMRQLAIGFTAVLLFAGSFAQAADTVPPTAIGAQAGGADPTWGGLGFGIGIGADFDIGGKRVTGATVVNDGVNNIVRVTDTSGNVNVSFVLETHYFLRDFILPKQAFCSPWFCTELGHGPFLALEINGGSTASTGSLSGPITGYALGWMVGFRKVPLVIDPLNPPAGHSWNFGIGLRIDPKAVVLGDGIVANQPLPAGEPTNPIRTKTEPRAGILLVSSFSF
jgi:hypothetical protein